MTPAAVGDRLSPEQRAQAIAVLRRRAAGASSGGPRPRDRSVAAPLSFSQLRLWFLQQWAPDAPTFNAVRAFRLRGPLDIRALGPALAGLVERHEALRTVFAAPPGGEPVQVVLDAGAPELPVLDVTEDALAARLRELAREPFDLAADRPMRSTLLRLAADDHVLLLRIHHVAGDAASTAVMFAELGELYAAALDGRPAVLPPLPVQFGDFAAWQRERLQGRFLADLTAYWTARLDGAPALLPLPTDRPRPAVQRHEGAHRHFTLPPGVAEGVDALAREERATLFMVTLAAFAALLYRVSGEPDVVIGSPMANRTHAELAGVVGFLSNTVALRVGLGGDPTFRDAVSGAREATLGALAHQEMPFEQVVSALRLPRDAGHNPLFQVNFRAQAAAPAVPELRDLDVTALTVDIGFSRFDLALELQAAPEGLAGYVEYDLDLFDAATVEWLVEAYGALLAQVLDNPDLPILGIRLPARPTPRRSGPRPRPSRDRRRADSPDQA
jgi:hypothetical protein